MRNNLMSEARTNGKKKFAIALSAAANHGKTSILRALADIFRTRNGVLLVDMQPMGTDVDEMWCFEKDGIHIGIATGGDDADAINMAFDFFEKNKCRIVFCATRYYSNSPSWNRFVTRCDSDGFERDWQGVDVHTLEVLKVMHQDVAENVLFKML